MTSPPVILPYGPILNRVQKKISRVMPCHRIQSRLTLKLMLRSVFDQFFEVFFSASHPQQIFFDQSILCMCSPPAFLCLILVLYLGTLSPRPSEQGRFPPPPQPPPDPQRVEQDLGLCFEPETNSFSLSIYFNSSTAI